MKDTLKNALTSRVAAFVGLVSSLFGAVIGLIFDVPFVSELFNWLLASAPSLFTFSSIFGRYVAPGLEAVPAEPFLYGAMGFGIVYGGHMLWKAIKSFREGVVL